MSNELDLQDIIGDLIVEIEGDFLTDDEINEAVDEIAAKFKMSVADVEALINA